MIRFQRRSDPTWLRRPAAYGSTGRVKSGYAVFKNRETGETWPEAVGDKYTYDIRIEDGENFI